jgi:hypothetical protein
MLSLSDFLALPPSSSNQPPSDRDSHRAVLFHIPDVIPGGLRCGAGWGSVPRRSPRCTAKLGSSSCIFYISKGGLIETLKYILILPVVKEQQLATKTGMDT